MKYNVHVKPFLKQIEEWSKNGATNDEIANALGVGRSTFYRYLKDHTELEKAVRDGRQKIVFDIRAALLKKALGFEYTEHKLTTKTVGLQKITTEEEIKKYSPPDTTAALVLLRNYDNTYIDRDKTTTELKENEFQLKKKIADNNNFDDFEGEDTNE
jgi:AcrR family transcriptional regulator